MLHHDWEAQTYDEKWSISFDERCVDYARDRFVAVAGESVPRSDDAWPYGKSLEIGAVVGGVPGKIIKNCHEIYDDPAEVERRRDLAAIARNSRTRSPTVRDESARQALDLRTVA